jgi:LPXTG-motif cell wall-anchored protein
VLHISLALAMMNAPGLVAQNQNASLTADVQMKDAAAGSFPASTCNPDVTDPGTTPPATTQPGTTQPGTTQPGTAQPAATQPRKILGYTGETFPTQLLLLGGSLVGVGWFLVVARRRRKREEVEQ